MKKGILFAFISFLYYFQGGAQSTEKFDSLMSAISFYADVMVNADQDEHRVRAHQVFVESISNLMAQPGSFNFSFEKIPWISELQADKLRIVTWQLRISDQEYKYGGFIQTPEKLIELKDSRPWINGSQTATYTAVSWYGALYYEMIPFQSGGKDFYLLLGFNAENDKVNTKVADILDLTGQDPVLGVPLFVGKEETQTRLMLTYADVASVHLNYDSTARAIIHDHLESLSGAGPSGEILVVSDGSQEAWYLKDDKWQYLEEYNDIKVEVPPMTEDRKERKEDKDLFGRPKKE
ncbi:MAG: hypothetical protein ABIQ11_05800 [Saprospiraceae bacterium]